jgi:hypothetical protein
MMKRLNLIFDGRRSSRDEFSFTSNTEMCRSVERWSWKSWPRFKSQLSQEYGSHYAFKEEWSGMGQVNIRAKLTMV